MKTTTNYGFKQPEGTDIVNIDDFSDNFGSVDTEIKKANDKVVAHEGKGGTVHADVTTTASGFMSASDKTKLNGVATGAQTNQNAVQSIQVVTPTGTVVGTATAANTTDTIQLKEGNNIDIAVSGKVVTVNNTYSYTHPTGDGNLHVPVTGTSNSGKVLKAGATAGSLTWGTLTPTDVGALPTSHEGQGGTVHADVTTTVSGFMSAADKTKLNGVAVNANNYSHPTNHPASIITQDSSNRFVTDTEKANWNAKASTVAATTSANGLMANTDKSKLDGIATGANNYVHPTGDGNSHVPATGTSNNGKVLKAGSATNSAAWGQVSWGELTEIPSSFPGGATGNATTATKLATARTISITGDVTASGTFDGSGNLALAATYKNSGVVAGTYTKVTTDAKGNITVGSNPTSLSEYGIVDAKDKAAVNIYKSPTSATAGVWNKLATCVITAQYASLACRLNIFGISNGSNGFCRATLDVRVKQQDPMGSRPFITIEESDYTIFTASNFVAVLTANSASITQVDIYAQTPLSYEAIYFAPVYNVGFTFFDGVPITTLPSGVQQYFAVLSATEGNVVLAQNGYQKLPGGLIIQWGLDIINQGGAQGATGTLNFPITFPKNVLSVNTNVCLVDGNTDAIGVFIVQPSTISLSQFLVKTRNTNGVGGTNIKINWIAIGY